MDFPSPHISVQTEAVEESPSVHCQFASTAQEASHPSPAVVSPSSQYPARGFPTIPFPQILVQVEAVVESPRVQDQSVSTEQEESQPSPAAVPPSSQYPAVGFITLPSPHISVQTEAVVASPRVHCQFASTAQEASQPSPATVPPSSQ